MSFGSGKGFGGGVGPSVGDHPASATDGALDLYVDGDNGDDGNPGTQAEPLATITEAESRIPDIVNDPVKVWVQPAASTYSVPTFRDRVLRDSIYVVGALDNDTFHFTELVPSTAGDPGSGGDNDKVIEVAGASFGVNTLRGKTVEVLSGPAAGDRRMVEENDDTSITAVHEFSAALNAGDTFRVVEPSVDVSLPPLLLGGTTSGARRAPRGDFPVVPGLRLINFHRDNAETFTVYGNAAFYGLDVFGAGLSNTRRWSTQGNGYLYVGCDAQVDNDSVASAGPVFGAASNTSWRGWGVGGGPTDLVFADRLSATFLGAVLDRLPITASQLQIVACRFFNGGVRSFSTSFESWVRIDRSFGDVGGEDDIRITGTLGWGLLVESPGSVFVLGGVVIDAGSAPAVDCRNGGIVRIFNSTTLTGSVGLLAREGGAIRFEDPRVIIDTVSDAETRVSDAGINTDQDVADYTSDGDYIASGDGAIVQRVGG